MEFQQAQIIVKQLSQGIDPLTGQGFCEESHYRHPQILHALHWLMQKIDGYEQVRQSQNIIEQQQRNLAKGFPKNVGLPWQDDDQRALQQYFRQGLAATAIAREFGRTTSSVLAELYRQKLVSLEQARVQLVSPSIR